MKKNDKKIDKDLARLIEKKREEFHEIELAILNLCGEREFSPNSVAPVLAFLFADISKDIDLSYEDCMQFAMRTVAEVYDIEIVSVDTKELDEVNIHKGSNTHQ